MRHVGLSASHVVPLHFPLQQAELPPSAEQVLPSDVHAAAEQNPFDPQLSEQQSVGALQGVPCAKHLPTIEVHRWVIGSQTPEQQVAPLVQRSLKTPHEIAPSEPASLVTAPPAPADPPPLPAEPPPAPAKPPAPPADTSTIASPMGPSCVVAPPLPPVALPPPVAPPPMPIVPPVPFDAPPRPPVARPPLADASPDMPPSPTGPAASSPPHPQNVKREAIATNFLKFMSD